MALEAFLFVRRWAISNCVKKDFLYYLLLRDFWSVVSKLSAERRSLHSCDKLPRTHLAQTYLNMNIHQYEDYDYINQEEFLFDEEDNVIPFEKPVEKFSKRRKPAKRIEFDVKVIDEGKSEFQFRGFMPPIKGAVALLGILGVGTILGILATLSIV